MSLMHKSMGQCSYYVNHTLSNANQFESIIYQKYKLIADAPMQ